MGRVYHVKVCPQLLAPVGTLVLGIGLVYVAYWSAAPNWPSALRWPGWLMLIFGSFGILGGLVGLIGFHKAVKEIEVGPKEIILRRRNGKEGTCRKIDKIAVGVFQRGRVWGRGIRIPLRWIGITGQTQDGKPWRTLIGKGGLKLRLCAAPRARINIKAPVP